MLNVLKAKKKKVEYYWFNVFVALIFLFFVMANEH